MFLLKRRLDALEIQVEGRDKAIGHMLNSAPQFWDYIKELQGDVKKIRDSEVHFHYFCRDVLEALRRIAPGSAAQIAPFPP